MHNMMFHIERQPEACQRVLDLEESTFEQAAPILHEKPSRVLVVATGSSMNATDMARPWFEAVTGLPLDAVEPSTFVNYGARPGAYDLVIAVSQRGTSTSTIDAVKAARDRYACPVIAVTGHPDNPLAGEVDAVIDIQCGPEDVPFSTVGVTSTALTMMLLALQMETKSGQHPDPVGRPALRETIAALNESVQGSTRYIDSKLADLQHIRRWFLLGYGPSLGAVREGELKMVETVRIPCTAHEIEAFMHGPIFEIGKGYGTWFTQTPTPGQERANQLLDFTSRYAEQIVGSTQSQTSDPRLLRLPESNPLAASLLHLVPIQVLAARLSDAYGVDLTVPAFPDFRSTLKTKVRWDS